VKNLKFIRANQTKFGGAEVYLSRLSNQLKKIGIQHEIIYSMIPKFLPSWIRVLLFNLYLCKNKKNNIYFSLERISCPDIYRAGDGVHRVFLTIENKSKTNLLHTVYLYLEKKCFLNAKKIIANSHMIKKEIISTFGVSESKIEVVYNGVSIEKPNFKNAYHELSKEFIFNKENGQKVFTYVGSGFKRKGVEDFLYILSKLEYKNFIAFVIGKEKKISYYKNLAIKLNLAEKIFFTGVRTDVKNFYTVSDIFLFPTKYEPFSNVVLEAMNYSNVVITTKQNGAHEILDSEFVMESSNDYSIVNYIDEILCNEQLQNSIKLKNMRIVRSFSIEKNVNKTLAVINEIIN